MFLPVMQLCEHLVVEVLPCINSRHCQLLLCRPKELNSLERGQPISRQLIRERGNDLAWLGPIAMFESAARYNADVFDVVQARVFRIFRIQQARQH